MRAAAELERVVRAHCESAAAVTTAVQGQHAAVDLDDASRGVVKHGAAHGAASPDAVGFSEPATIRDHRRTAQAELVLAVVRIVEHGTTRDVQHGTLPAADSAGAPGVGSGIEIQRAPGKCSCITA